MKKLVVIIPCFNEEATLPASFERTKKVLDTMPFQTEIIFVNFFYPVLKIFNIEPAFYIQMLAMVVYTLFNFIINKLYTFKA